jgi:hypothetical protein
MLRRIIGALRLDPTVYRELRDDPTATVPGTPVRPALCPGSWRRRVTRRWSDRLRHRGLLLPSCPGRSSSSRLTSSARKRCRGRRPRQRWERWCGHSASPWRRGLLLVFGVVPALQLVVVPAGFLSGLSSATLMALRETLAVGTLRALLVAVLSYGAAALLGSILTPPGPSG